MFFKRNNPTNSYKGFVNEVSKSLERLEQQLKRLKDGFIIEVNAKNEAIRYITSMGLYDDFMKYRQHPSDTEKNTAKISQK